MIIIAWAVIAGCAVFGALCVATDVMVRRERMEARRQSVRRAAPPPPFLYVMLPEPELYDWEQDD